MATLKITQRKSTIGCPPDQIGTMRALGLRRIGTTVEKADTPDIRGMVFKVQHLVEVEGVSGDTASGAPQSTARSNAEGQTQRAATGSPDDERETT